MCISHQVSESKPTRKGAKAEKGLVWPETSTKSLELKAGSRTCEAGVL
jgi:hypothetical protein